MQRHPVFPVNTVGFARALNTLDCSLCDFILFAEFGNLTGQRHALVCQFRRGVLSAHLLDDFSSLRGKGFHLLGQTLAIGYDCLQRWKLVVVDKGVFCKYPVYILSDGFQFRAVDAGLLFLGQDA